MKRTLISILCFVTIINAAGQQNYTEDFTDVQSPVNIALEEVNQVFTPPAVNNGSLKSGLTNESEIIVTYINFPEEAKMAFEYAVSIWEQNISSPVPINIHANWDDLSDNLLGHGKPSLFYRNFKGTPQANIYYPVALVEKITGKEYNSSTEADITCTFNKSKPWYFGTNGQTLETQYDFVTAVLHEIGHGLGISGFFIAENGIAKYSNSSNSPSVYDYFVFNTNQQRIADKTLFPSPSAELTKQLTSNSLVFNYSTETNETTDASIYAPSTWTNGVSIYHLIKTDNSVGSPNELMNAHAYKGEAIHNPGVKTLHVLSEMGWSVKSATTDQNVSTGNDEELFASENLNIYPNPFSSNLTFECGNFNNQTSVDITITDLTGKIVYREKMTGIQYNPKLKVDLSAIKSGIYLASLTDENYKTITKRIIKN
ncbi:MAG TPA: T9SS type A sorting domain-containing protein [Draconibacterium sp.]|nr:T9SS type A sorting domain-containing protein [Draconibacterium sp.]